MTQNTHQNTQEPSISGKIKFPLLESGELDLSSKSTGLSSLPAIFAMQICGMERKEGSIFAQTDRDGLIKFLSCSNETSKEIGESIKAISSLLALVDWEYIGIEDTFNIPRLISQLSDLQTHLSDIQAEAVSCLATGCYIGGEHDHQE